MSDIHRKVGMGADLLVAALIDRDDQQVATGHRRFYAPYLEQLQPFPAAAELLRGAAELLEKIHGSRPGELARADGAG